ncbi:baseplate J/gp47 family protein [Pararhizobium sp. O133]|uniref:baseplate J/gp47 family protein n=1 Tax=Pararhizobium sp. O133 TaxID=3449278 RepID=UPI003F68374D
MAWNVRSLAETSQRARGAFRQYMPGTDSALKNNFVTVTGKVLAALSHEFELRMAYLAQQLFLQTASGQFLVMHCADVGIYRKAASAATGKISGTGAASTTYPIGVRFISGNTIYRSTASAKSGVGGAVTFTVRSDAKGSAVNRDAGGILAVADPVLFPTLDDEFTVGDDGLGGGADIETDDSLRMRGLQRKQNPPGGGTLTDYERIARSVPGVIKAWAFRDPLAPGFLVVFFLFTGRENSIPEASDVTAVQAAIDAKRLIRVDDSVARAPVARPVNVTINGLSSDTSDTRAAIAAGIRAMFLARCRPGIPGDTFNLSKSWIAEAVSQAAGESRHVLVAPSADIELTDGEFPVLGTVTYGA